MFKPGRAADVLTMLNPMQRAALTLRYVDDLPVPIGSVLDAQPPRTYQAARPMHGFGSTCTTFADRILRINNTTMSVVAEIHVPGSTMENGGSWIGDIAIGRTGVWVLDHQTPTYAARIDPATNEIAEPIEVGDNARSIAYGAGSLWIAHGLDVSSLARIDPATGAEVARIPLDFVPGVVITSDERCG